MRVWLACFLVLFGLSELFQWMKQLSLPLPVFILGGAFLAIVSNYDRRAGFPFNMISSPTRDSQAMPPAPAQTVIPRSSSPQKPISFTIRKSD
ncbi:hypothetical protein C7B65_14085 [Phormidesmis priestleyi ULC007]|uniref:Uncharacterized protein n=1 Tax=Phormidesmis priestleyi ULC007 TaxID=1920490 RepID=A0A2T1DDW4_9CYAN|nr:hypothetical protein [Phormidesmis priestleyi]PSB18654.1 hypothetical protein C7B65_14085 [Phormidesmis priestleyi ULC007]PZO51585.1 MAG: hypothetical protein DCF14_08785 [Phormidesmis priestleyi]